MLNLKVTQRIPETQVDILLKALNVLEMSIKTVNNYNMVASSDSALYDITTLKGLLKHCTVEVKTDVRTVENFVSLANVDFPEYIIR